MANLAADVLTNDQTGVFERRERPYDVELVHLAVGCDGLGGVEREAADHDGEARQHPLGQRGQLVP